MGEQIKRFITYYIKAFFISIMVSVTGIMVTAVLLYKGVISGENLKLAISIIYFVATLGGGFIACKYAQSKRFLWGIIYGLVYFLLILLLSFVTNGDESTNINYVSLIICAIGGMLGGMFG